MKPQTVKALSYCFDALGFIFQHPEAGRRIKSIYLFGSAVRGAMEKTSDVDLFVECVSADESRVKRLIDSGLVKFASSKDYQKWKIWRFTPEFSVQIGRLAEWELAVSIASEGLLLYHRQSLLTAGERKVLFIIKYPSQKKRYIRLRRLLFGRDELEFQDTGLLKKFQGEKINSNVFIVPKEYQSYIIEALAKEKIDFSMREISVFG